jgi:6-phosphogluconolactonase (cycloisomerase 2 family)
MLTAGTLVSAACGGESGRERPDNSGRGGHGSSGGAPTAGAGAAGLLNGGAPTAGATLAGGAPAAGSTAAGTAGSGAGLGGLGGLGGDAGTGGAPAKPSHHIYVGCADSAGTLEGYSVQERKLSRAAAFVTGGAISNSSFNADETRLYVAYVAGDTEARIVSYVRDTMTGALRTVGWERSVPFEGGEAFAGAGEGGGGGEAPTAKNAGPQTLTLAMAGGYVAVPSDLAGTVAIYDMLPDDSVGPLVASDSQGVGPHHAIFSNNDAFLLVPYLGSNKITVYDFDAASGALSFDHDVPMPLSMSGPRHLALHANGQWLYAINETAGGAEPEAGTLDWFTFDQATGALAPMYTYDVPLPAGYDGVKSGAEIVISPGGKSLYVSMRLDHRATGELVVYDIGTNGSLVLQQQESVRGVTPRHFSLSRDGSMLIVANQDSDGIVLMSVNSRTGRLNFLDEASVCDSPRFARFADGR